MGGHEGDLEATAGVAPIRNKSNGDLVQLCQQRGWEHIPAEFTSWRQRVG